MAEDKQLTEFVERLKSAGGTNLQCVALFGSAAAEEFHPGFSDINLLCVVRELSAAVLDALAPAVQWWTNNHHPAPLIFSGKEMDRVAAVFPIEMLDVRQQHRILHGEDIFQNMQVPMDRHRVQLDHELRTKLLFLSQHYLLACGDAGRVRHLMLDSASNFITLFRHTLIAMGQKPPRTKAEVTEQLAQRAKFDASPFLQLLQVRERKLTADSVDARATFAKYFEGIEKVIQVLDAIPVSSPVAAAL